MNFTRNYRSLGIVLLALSLTGCMIGPDYQQPDIEVPLQGSWLATEQAGFPDQFAESPPQPAWWNQFRDPQLSALINELVSSSLSLAQARERVVEARARRGVVNADRLPQVDVEGDVTHAETGEKGVSFQGPPPGQDIDIYNAGAVAGWEIDLWGRVKRLVEAEDRDIEAEREALNDIAVSLVAELTLAYVETRTLEARLALVDQKIVLQQKVLELRLVSEEAGSGTRLQRVQAQKELQKIQALRPGLEQQLNVTLNGIDALLGRVPQGNHLPVGGMPEVPSLLGMGVPADLLVRRADIREAERRYAASVARIGAAMAEKYPRLTLSGSFSLQSDAVENVFDAEAFVYSLGPGLQFPLFSGGRIESQVSVRKSQAEQARLALEQKLIGAVKEVEDAATGVVRTQENLRILMEATGLAHESLVMAQHLYDAGLEGLGQVIDAERELVSLEDELILARQAALEQTVLLYRALGGGWAALNVNKTAAATPPILQTNSNQPGSE